MRANILACLPIGLFVLTAGADPASSGKATPIQPAPETARPPAKSGGNGASHEAIEKLAYDTLREHLSRPVEEFEILRMGSIEWPDSSLGCPKPGMSYLQVITPGHYAILRSGDEVYRVHMAEGRGFVCESSAVDGKVRPTPQVTFSERQLQALATADLAERLGVPRDTVDLVRTEPVQWADTSLGCPLRGQHYEPRASKGYVFTLQHDGREYRYHADLQQVLPCPPVARE